MKGLWVGRDREGLGGEEEETGILYIARITAANNEDVENGRPHRDPTPTILSTCHSNTAIMHFSSNGITLSVSEQRNFHRVTAGWENVSDHDKAVPRFNGDGEPDVPERSF